MCLGSTDDFENSIPVHLEVTWIRHYTLFLDAHQNNNNKKKTFISVKPQQLCLDTFGIDQVDAALVRLRDDKLSNVEPSISYEVDTLSCTSITAAAFISILCIITKRKKHRLR